MAKNIEKIEIFSTGKHFGSETVEITENDLTEMVNSFNALSSTEGFRPVLKLGHDEAQEFFGNRKGLPNLGFVDKIWKVGKKILANFSNVPDALVDLIAKHRYNAVSIEMFPKTEVGGKVFSNVLTAVALLGAELPAVKGLKELAATLFTETPEGPAFSGEFVKLTSEEDKMTTFTQEQVDQLIDAAVVKAVDGAKASFEAKVTELNSKVADAEKAKKTANEALRSYEDAALKTDAETMVDDAIKKGKIAPAQKDEALAFALTLNGTVKFGNTEKSASSVFKSFIEALPVKVDFSEKGVGNTNDEDGSDAGAEVHDMTKKMVNDKDGMDYQSARIIVLAENPALKERYYQMED